MERSHPSPTRTPVTYCGHRFYLWLSLRPVEGVIKTGSFTQDARERWYVNLQCEVPDATAPGLGRQRLV